MPSEKTRAHIVVPKDLLDGVDRLVGRRGRSRFVAEAIQEKLARQRLIEVAARAAGSLAEVDVPGWETTEAAADWVHELRRSGQRDYPQP